MKETRREIHVNDIQGYAKVLDRMRNLCSRREYCSSDILRKASDALGKYQTDKNLAASAASMLLESLVEDKYVDDRRYAAAFAREKSSISGWGIVKIRYALSLKGIDKSVIEQAFEELDIVAADARLEKLLENKFRSLKEDSQYRLKLIRFALGRGYSYEKSIKVIAAIERNQH